MVVLPSRVGRLTHCIPTVVIMPVISLKALEIPLLIEAVRGVALVELRELAPVAGRVEAPVLGEHQAGEQVAASGEAQRAWRKVIRRCKSS